ncbi:MAG: hypothetical protein ACPLKP_02500, partial [Microgenomates group bacterium]
MENKKKLFLIFLLICFSFFLVFYLTVSRQKRQELRKKAAAEEKILVSLLPSSNDSENPWPPNSENEIKVKLTNTSQETLTFRVVGIYFSFDSNIFDLNTNNLRCELPFSLALGNASKVEGNSFQLICFLPGNTYQNNNPYTLNSQQSIDIATIKLKVKTGINFQQTQINFVRVNIPHEETLDNLGYYSSSSVTYYVGATQPNTEPTSQPTSTSSPTPQPTSTLTPEPTTSSPTPRSFTCQQGDLNQDG